MKLTLRYSITHFTHWASVTGATSFAALYLMNRGISSEIAGTLLALSGLLSCASQPLLAALADKSKEFVIVKMLMGMSMLCCLCFLVQLIPGIPLPAVGLFYMLGLWCSDAMVPILNALSVGYEEAGYRMDYGVARGVGAIASALSALVAGFLIADLGEVWMIVFLLFFRVICILSLAGYPAISKSTEMSRNRFKEDVQCSCSVPQFFVKYKWYCISLMGILFLGMFHAMTENYLIVIMEKLGGDSSNVGIAIGIAGMVAFPVICGFSWLHRYLKNSVILKISAVSFLLKAVLFYVAGNVTAIYFVQLLQATTYALLAPAQVAYANEKVKSCDMVKGQAFVTAAYALGCSGGNFAGGQLLPLGADTIMQAGIAMALTGTVILFLTVNRWDDKLPQN